LPGETLVGLADLDVTVIPTEVSHKIAWPWNWFVPKKREVPPEGLCQKASPTRLEFFRAKPGGIEPGEQEPLVMRARGFVHGKAPIPQIPSNVEKEKEMLYRLNARPGIEGLSNQPAPEPPEQHSIQIILGCETEPAAGLQDTADLRSHRPRARNVFQAFTTYDPVKGVIGKRQRLSVGDHKADWLPGRRGSIPGEPDGRARKVDSRYPYTRCGGGQPYREFSSPTADFQKVAAYAVSNAIISSPIPRKPHGGDIFGLGIYLLLHRMPLVIGNHGSGFHDFLSWTQSELMPR
jgi:hypothetical protein